MWKLIDDSRVSQCENPENQVHKSKELSDSHAESLPPDIIQLNAEVLSKV